MNILETKRILLRQLTLEDLDNLYALYSNENVKKYVYAESMNYEETKEELDWIIDVYTSQPGYGLWATIHKETGDFMGRCGLLQWTIEEQPEVELTYMFAENIGGKDWELK